MISVYGMLDLEFYAGVLRFKWVLWVFNHTLVRHTEFNQYAEHPSCALEPEFGRPKSFGLLFSGLDRSIGPFWSTELGIFGWPIGFRSADFGLSCFPSLFPYDVNNVRFWGLLCFSPWIDKCFQRDFLRKNMDCLQTILPRFFRGRNLGVVLAGPRDATVFLVHRILHLSWCLEGRGVVRT